MVAQQWDNWEHLETWEAPSAGTSTRGTPVKKSNSGSSSSSSSGGARSKLFGGMGKSSEVRETLGIYKDMGIRVDEDPRRWKGYWR